ncbi:hypothetical protein E2562_007454 [Oryza meyeriana var. granulata]|uniref:Protein kinase domain-containing protein n=1 Tax=Oryza meyeriana var. granulata TaxID=110450 RepID=A0A6G1F512_9ORYZ|nr:hypothetical protein E2562_007454 [Oryza meyeriana var. granulata]
MPFKLDQFNSITVKKFSREKSYIFLMLSSTSRSCKVQSKYRCHCWYRRGNICCSSISFIPHYSHYTEKAFKTFFFKETLSKRIPMKIDGVKDFSFEELSHGTNDFSDSALVGQGGYGKVYRGILADGTIVAIKRAQQGSLQGSKEFFTEIELLSRLHHRNLSLLGYCDEEDEQMLVYEFMPNGTLRDHLSG